eukprot:6967174-Heterocapsa_arctica.AAC.1
MPRRGGARGFSSAPQTRSARGSSRRPFARQRSCAGGPPTARRGPHSRGCRRSTPPGCTNR